MKNFLKLCKYLKKYKKYIIFSLLFLVIEALMEIMLPNIVANIINIGLKDNNTKYIMFNIGIMIILTILGILGGIGSIYFTALSNNNAIKDIRYDIIKKISEYNINDLRAGNLLTVLTNDIKIIGTVFMVLIRFIFKIPIVLIGSIIMSLFISPKLSIILLFIIPILVIVLALIMKKSYPKFYQMQNSLDDINDKVRENISGIRVVKSFTRENEEINKFNKINKNLKNISIKAIRLITLQLPILILLVNITIILVLYYGNIEILNNNLKIGDVIAFTEYLSNILSMFAASSIMFMMLIEGEASACRINEIFNKKCKVDKNITNKNIKGKIEFKNVNFSYDGENVLENINLVIDDKVTAIIGKTGSGKSTLAYLITRFYEPSSGEILIDDINIKEYGIKNIRKKISLVLQENLLFNDTIENNIEFAKKSSIEEIKKVAKISEAHEFIMKKEKQYNHLIDQEGANLSGGEKQRICIARTLLLNPNMIILDDSTSSVDLNTERKIHENLKKEYKDKKIIIISQKIRTIKSADKIIVLDDGRISGIGSHQELLKSNKVYKEIYESQMDGDLDV